MNQKFLRKLIEVEIRLGFINIPKQAIDLFPSEKTKIKVLMDGKEKSLSYDPKNRRIYGLTNWYKQNKLKTQDLIKIIKIDEKKFDLKVEKEEQQEKEIKEIDLSGLSSLVKGDIVEDRIKELILIYGQGLLSVYKPVNDTEGIDLIVVKNGNFHPIFVQVKSRFTLTKTGAVVIRIKKKTFNPHNNYYVVGVFFSTKDADLDDNILLIPSSEVTKNATIVNSPSGEWYSIVTNMTKSDNTKWGKFIINKKELAEILINKFLKAEEYYR